MFQKIKKRLKNYLTIETRYVYITLNMHPSQDITIIITPLHALSNAGAWVESSNEGIE